MLVTHTLCATSGESSVYSVAAAKNRDRSLARFSSARRRRTFDDLRRLLVRLLDRLRVIMYFISSGRTGRLRECGGTRPATPPSVDRAGGGRGLNITASTGPNRTG